MERPWIAAHIQGRLHELEKVRTWERNPQVYGEMLGASLAGQALFDYAPADERARRVLSKLRQTPRLIQSARDNIKEPPGIFVKNGLETLRGTLRFIESDLPRAFADVDDLGLLGDLADAQTEAIDALKSYMRTSRPISGRRRARRSGSAPTGSPPSSASKKASTSRSTACSTSGCASSATCRRSSASPPGASSRAIPRGLAARQGPPRAADGIVNAAREQMARLATFIERRDLVSLPAGEPVMVAPTPDFFRWPFASMWTPGPFEARPTRAYYYLTDAERGGRPSASRSTCAT